MNFLLDPNVAYLIVLAGIFLAFLAVVTPGTGLLELAALFCFALAGFEIYRLSVHWWALGIILLSVFPLIFSIRNPKQKFYLPLSILLLIAGSLFLFASDDRLISVDPVLATVASLLVGISLWFLITKSIEAMNHKPIHDINTLMGQIGEAKSKISEEGSVNVAGELWSARSDKNIPIGSRIRVVGREGFILVVEKVDTVNS